MQDRSGDMLRPRISPEFVRSLPAGFVNAAIEDCCSVCLERYCVREGVTLLPCNHVFHTHCIHAAFNHDYRCPLCRLKFPTLQPPPPRTTVFPDFNVLMTRLSLRQVPTNNAPQYDPVSTNNAPQYDPMILG